VNALRKLSSWTISVRMTSARPETTKTPPSMALVVGSQNYVGPDKGPPLRSRTTPNIFPKAGFGVPTPARFGLRQKWRNFAAA
jgi:hypothetical protein